MSWSVQVETRRDSASRQALAVELDPRLTQARLAWRILGLGDAEVGSRAVFRQFVEVAEPDLGAGADWLRGADAQALLARVSGGYTGTMTWSGDAVATWTQDAWHAAEAVVAGATAAVGR